MAACAADKALRPEAATPQHLKPFINAAFPTLLTASPAALLAHLECLKAFNAMAATAMPTMACVLCQVTMPRKSCSTLSRTL